MEPTTSHSAWPARALVVTALAVIVLTSLPSVAWATTGAAGVTAHPTNGVGKATGVFEVCPVDAPRHYRDDFGEPRYVGGFHRHEGNDIMAPEGTPIRAPFDGLATSSVSWAGGVQIYVYGRRGFVFNSHVLRTAKLGHVRAGTIVGNVGRSGAASAGVIHDHFEWHPHDRPAVDPFPFLNSVCRERSALEPPGESLRRF